jgi:hypothetical protein
MDGTLVRPEPKPETLSALDALIARPVARKSAALSPEEAKLAVLMPRLVQAASNGTAASVLCDVLLSSEGIEISPSALLKKLARARKISAKGKAVKAVTPAKAAAPVSAVTPVSSAPVSAPTSTPTAAPVLTPPVAPKIATIAAVGPDKAAIVDEDEL